MKCTICFSLVIAPVVFAENIILLAEESTSECIKPCFFVNLEIIASYARWHVFTGHCSTPNRLASAHTTRPFFVCFEKSRRDTVTMLPDCIRLIRKCARVDWNRHYQHKHNKKNPRHSSPQIGAAKIYSGNYPWRPWGFGWREGGRGGGCGSKRYKHGPVGQVYLTHAARLGGNSIYCTTKTRSSRPVVYGLLRQFTRFKRTDNIKPTPFVCGFVCAQATKAVLKSVCSLSSVLRILLCAKSQPAIFPRNHLFIHKSGKFVFPTQTHGNNKRV